MKKILLIAAIFAVLFVGSIYYVTDLLSKQIERETEVYKNKIGEKIVLNKDTLIIVDYSMIYSNYTLDNGAEVSFELVDRLLSDGEK